MIVREKTSPLALMFAWRGSILPRIIPMIAAITALSAIAVWLCKWQPEAFSSLSSAPYSLLGLALSIFMSFRNNASYDRWWEGRRQLGAILAEMRSLARILRALSPTPDGATTRRVVICAGIGFCHALAARLRDGDERAAAARWLPAKEAQQVAARTNVPDAILSYIGSQLGASKQSGHIGAVEFGLLEAKLSNLSAAQAACERIRTTPLPFAYTLLLHRTAYLFCAILPFALAGSLGWWTPVASALVAYTFFGLDALGDELEEPFGLDANDLPVDALVRTIEIDLLEGIGEAAPAPMAPRNYVLS